LPGCQGRSRTALPRSRGRTSFAPSWSVSRNLTSRTSVLIIGNGHFPEWASREPVPLRTQLTVLHAVRPASFAGGWGAKFSANADSKPPTHSAAMAQQMRLSAPRNRSSLKLRQIPCPNILALFAFLISKNS
jgi:hypothetical protein